MAALTAAAYPQSRCFGPIRRYKMKASVTIYAGGVVMLDSNGLANPAAASASNQGCVGVATSTVTSAASGTYYCEVQEGTFRLPATSIADTDVGNVVYCADDSGLHDETQGSNEPRLGFLESVESSTVGWVMIGLGVHA